MTNELAVRNTSIISTYDEVERVAKAMAASGFFPDAQSISKAVVKIMAGAEIGFGPFASMQGVNIIKGKPSYNANMLASSVKASGRYDYRIVKLNDEICDLAFFEAGQEVGHSIFNLQDARRAGVSNLDKFPRNMLFARAMSNGVRWYCPDVTNGNAVYTPEELGAEVDEDGNVIDGTYSAPEQVEQPEPKREQVEDAITDAGPVLPENGHYDFKTRPYDAPTLKAALAKKVEKIGSYEASDKQRNLLGALLSEYFQDDAKRYECSEWLFGARSTKDIDGAMVKAALDWLNPQKDEGGAYAIDDMARKELATAHTAALEASGQEALL
jgi:hypothetical protein